MPDIPVGAQIFDLIFHPKHSTVYTGLLTGEIKAFAYDTQGQHESSFSLRPSKRSCRGLSIGEDGCQLWAVGKAKSLFSIDTATGKLWDTRPSAHDAPINRVKYLTPGLLSTGDDDGVIKLWDPRKADIIGSYDHHFDFISDFLWLGDKKQLVATSGDGTLSVIDVRSKKTDPFAHSEDQEDELLSIIPIKGGAKTVVGTQLGILSIFNKSSGWRDCVDRVPGHPQSIDALCGLPSSYPSSHSTILTGSSDGLLRAVQLFPTKLIGVVADHGEFPIERIAVDLGGEGSWVGSAGHDDVLKMTDLKEVFEDENMMGGEGKLWEGGVDAGSRAGNDDDGEIDVGVSNVGAKVAQDEGPEGVSDGEASDVPQQKRKRKEKDPLSGRKKKGRNQVDAEPTFFSDL